MPQHKTKNQQLTTGKATCLLNCSLLLLLVAVVGITNAINFSQVVVLNTENSESLDYLYDAGDGEY